MAIVLEKGQKINLSKEAAESLHSVCVGLNWGVIDKTFSFEKKGFLGIGNKTICKDIKVDVDLDASCVLLGNLNQNLEVISYKNLVSKYNCIFHSGDDRSGDKDGQDDLDNEIISVNLTMVPAEVEQIIFFLNSFKKQDFADIPYATIRIYEGKPNLVNKVIVKYDVANSAKFKGKVSMVMGKFFRKEGNWEFKAIGEPTDDTMLEDTVKTIVNTFA